MTDLEADMARLRARVRDVQAYRGRIAADSARKGVIYRVQELFGAPHASWVADLTQVRLEVRAQIEAALEGLQFQRRAGTAIDATQSAGMGRDLLALAVEAGMGVVPTDDLIERLQALYFPDDLNPAARERQFGQGRDELRDLLSSTPPVMPPVGTLLQVIAASLPGLADSVGAAAGLSDRQRTALLDTALHLFVQGAALAIFVGRDSQFDKACLAIAQSEARRVAAARWDRGLLSGMTREACLLAADSTVAMRFELTRANEQLSEILRRHGALRDLPLSDLHKDEGFVRLVVDQKKAKRAAREVALLLVWMNAKERRVLRQEQTLLGAWPGFDLAALDAEAGPEAPHPGLTHHMLQRLGMNDSPVFGPLDDDDGSALLARVEQFVQQGLSDIDDLAGAQNALRSARASFSRASLLHPVVEDASRRSVAALSRRMAEVHICERWIAQEGRDLDPDHRRLLRENLETLLAASRVDHPQFAELFGDPACEDAMAIALASLGIDRTAYWIFRAAIGNIRDGISAWRSEAAVLRQTSNDYLCLRADGTAASASECEAIHALRRDAEPAICEAAVDLIREAAAACLPRGGKAYAYMVRDGGSVNAFDLAAWRATIEAQLRGWGFPCDEFLPELDRELSGQLTLDRLEAWSRQSQSWRMRGGEIFATAEEAAREVLSSSRDEAEAALAAVVAGLQEGDKINLVAGTRHGVQGAVPLDQTGLLKLKLALNLASVHQLEIERSSGGYKVALRAGQELGAGSHVQVGHAISGVASATASLGVDASASSAIGYVFSFENDESGRRALLAFLGDLRTEGARGWTDFAEATDVARSRESIHKAVLGLRGKLGLKLPLPIRGVGPRVGLLAEAGIGVATKRSHSSSLAGATVKSESSRTIAVRAGARAEWGAGSSDLMDAATALRDSTVPGRDLRMPEPASEDLARIERYAGRPNLRASVFSVTASATRTTKVKQVHGDLGDLTQAEFVHQSDFGSLDAVSEDSFRALIVHRPDDSGAVAQKKATLRSNIQQVLALWRRGDVLAITYSARPEALKRANDLAAHARESRQRGKVRVARALEGQSRRIVANRSNYRPTKLSLVQTQVQARTDRPVIAPVYHRETYAWGKSEFNALVLSLS